MNEITDLLRDWNNGDKDAFNRLAPHIERELKRRASNYLRGEKPGHILSTTALVHEALIKLIQENIEWKDRHQFYAFVAKRMKQVLINDARSRQAEKRAGEQVALSEADQKTDEKAREVVLLNEALDELQKLDPLKVKLVENKFLLGLTYEELAKQMGSSVATVQREWKIARAWLEGYMTKQNRDAE